MSSGPDGTTTSNGLHCVAGRPKSQSKHPLFSRTVPGPRPQCGTYMYPSTVRPDVRELQDEPSTAWQPVLTGLDSQLLPHLKGKVSRRTMVAQQLNNFVMQQRGELAKSRTNCKFVAGSRGGSTGAGSRGVQPIEQPPYDFARTLSQEAAALSLAVPESLGLDFQRDWQEPPTKCIPEPVPQNIQGEPWLCPPGTGRVNAVAQRRLHSRAGRAAGVMMNREARQMANKWTRPPSTGFLSRANCKALRIAQPQVPLATRVSSPFARSITEVTKAWNQELPCWGNRVQGGFRDTKFVRSY